MTNKKVNKRNTRDGNKFAPVIPTTPAGDNGVIATMDDIPDELDNNKPTKKSKTKQTTEGKTQKGYNYYAIGFILMFILPAIFTFGTGVRCNICLTMMDDTNY